MSPVEVDEFRIGNGETYDVIVQPKEAKAYSIFVPTIARIGYALGTLAPELGMSAPVPAMGPKPVRTMADMGMAGMDMSGSASTSGAADASGMAGMPGMGMPGMGGLGGMIPGMGGGKLPKGMSQADLEAMAKEMGAGGGKGDLGKLLGGGGKLPPGFPGKLPPGFGGN